MICPTCQTSLGWSHTVARSAISDAMNEIRRVYVCDNGHRIDTVEMPRAELQSLRVMAHMGQRRIGAGE